MMRLLEPPSVDRRLIGVEISGQMTTEEMQVLIARLQEVVNHGQRALLLIDMQHYEGFEFGVAREKLKHMGMLWKALDRYAVVGASRWVEIWIDILDPVTPPDMKHFAPEEISDAWRWLVKGDPS